MSYATFVTSLRRRSSYRRRTKPRRSDREATMQARMTNPAMLLPDTMKEINLLRKAAHAAGVPESTLELVHPRASHMNGCRVREHSGPRSRKKHGDAAQLLAA